MGQKKKFLVGARKQHKQRPRSEIVSWEVPALLNKGYYVQGKMKLVRQVRPDSWGPWTAQ